MCVNGNNSRIPYLCDLSDFLYRSTMRKINHSRIVAGNCIIVQVNSNNSRQHRYRIRIAQTVLFCAVYGPADLYFPSAKDQPFGLPPYILGRIGNPVPRDTRAL